MEKKQKTQEDEYSFPYHYVPQFSDFSISYCWTWGLQYISALEYILKEVEKIEFENLCDVGAGDGRLVSELTKMFSDKDIEGFDYSEKAIALAKALNPECKYRCLDIFNEKIASQYDIVTLIEVFEHIPLELAKDFAGRVISLVRPGGYLLITVPHKNKPLQDKHFQHFTLEKLKEYFIGQMEIVEEVYFERRSKSLYFTRLMLSNKHFILNNRKLKNFLYKRYLEKHFYATDKNCGRIYMKLKKL